ncbi:hypothetical protein RSJ42_10180 [Methanosarcina hadiensis]|uniref:hypothetical protein n=1 Tax=Methanosarcina hadiensis TaxID=3078083 RepID=UPI003977501E
MGDSMNIWKVLILCMIASVLVLPVALADEEHTVNSANKDNPVSDKKDKVDYIVTPATGDPGFSTKSTQSITQGQTITHNVNAGTGVNSIEVDLYWGDTSDSLTLSVYTPSGSKVGTYRDNFDGSVNGRIHLNIDPSQGYVQQGTWKFKVYGESVSGSQSYTFTAALH